MIKLDCVKNKVWGGWAPAGERISGKVWNQVWFQVSGRVREQVNQLEWLGVTIKNDFRPINTDL